MNKDGKIACACWNYQGFEGDWSNPFTYGWTSEAITAEAWEANPTTSDASYSGPKYKDIWNDEHKTWNAGWGTAEEQLERIRAGKPKLRSRSGVPTIFIYKRCRRPGWTRIEDAAAAHAAWVAKKLDGLNKGVKGKDETNDAWATLAKDAAAGDEIAYGKAVTTVTPGQLSYNSAIPDYAKKVATRIQEVRAILAGYK
jgi:hypothetical protein